MEWWSGNVWSQLLLAAVSTALLSAIVFVARGLIRWSKRSLARRRRKLRLSAGSPLFTNAWIVNYYRKAGRVDDLYVARSVDAPPLAILTKEEWTTGPFDLGRLFPRRELERVAMPEDSRVLRRRRGLVPMVRPDGSIWNDDIVLVEGVGQGPLIQLAVGSYFQYLSACGALEDETLAAIRSKIPIRTPLRNRNLGSLSAAASGALRAQGVGANVVTVLMEENPKVLIQRRATTLAIYPGAWAVAPVFGCQPVSRGQGMEFDLLVDLFREYLEEFFDFEEAIHRNQRRLSDDWFLDEGPVVRLRQNLDRGTAEFELLGFGFDAFNGELDLSCLLTLPGDIAERDLRSVSANWEYGSIERVGLFSDALSGRIAAGDFQPGSAFALDLARQRLAPSSSPVAS